MKPSVSAVLGSFASTFLRGGICVYIHSKSPTLLLLVFISLDLTNLPNQSRHLTQKGQAENSFLSCLRRNFADNLELYISNIPLVLEYY